MGLANIDNRVGPSNSERVHGDQWLDWTISSDNTNLIMLLEDKRAPLAKYFAKAKNLYKCPADKFASPAQRARGWTERVRRISMNAFSGWPNVCRKARKMPESFRARKSNSELPQPAIHYQV